MHQPDAQRGQIQRQLLVSILRRLQLQRLGLLDQRAHPISLPPFLDMLFDETDHVVAPVIGHQPRLDRRATGRQLVEHGYIEVGVIAHGQGARNRRRRHHQLVRVAALLAQGQALRHAEAVLLVDDSQAQFGEIDTVLDQRMSTDDQLRLSRRRGQLFALGLGLQAARQPGHTHAQGLQPVTQFQVVLLGENFSRRHERCLPSCRNRLASSQRGDDGLAGPDIALQQPMHWVWLRQVGPDLGHRPRLRAGQAEGQAIEQPCPEVVARPQHRRPLLAARQVSPA